MTIDTEMAYVAGTIDGDGSFSIMKSRGKYYPCIQLSNAFKGMSEFLHEKFGGSLRIKKPQQPHHKVLYVWSVRGLEGCLKAIERFEKYLVLKRPQADLMVEFIKRRSSSDFSEIDGERFSLKMRKIHQDIVTKSDTLEGQTSLDNVSPYFWAYFAGLMDTEGSFSIKKEKPHSGSVSARYNPMVQLTMVPSACINFIRENFSMGSFCIPKSTCTQKGYAYKMSIMSKDECMRFLHKIIDYLRFKKGQGFTLLNFCENYGSVKHCRGGIPLETLEFREEMYKQMIKLNA